MVAFRIDPATNFQHDEYAIAHAMRERGWVIPAYTMAPHSEKLKLMRIVVREDFSRARCDALIKDMTLVMETLKDTDAKWLKEHQEHMKKAMRQTTERSKINSHYGKEDHSLQAKSGKTHAVC